MAWTTPTTRSSGHLLTAAQINADLIDNLVFLKTPAFSQYITGQDTDYQTASTSFTDVDATNLALAITTTANSSAAVGFVGTIRCTTATNIAIYFDVDIDGTRIGTEDGFIGSTTTASTATQSIAFVVWKTVLSAASHTAKLQWKVSAATAELSAGAGTSTRDVHSIFWFREMT